MQGTVWIPLHVIAIARSGDKGDHVNVGLVSRRREWFEALREAISVKRAIAWFGTRVQGKIELYELPGIGALNLMLHHALDGGGTVSLRMDAQGKTMGQAMLQARVPLASDLALELDIPLDHVTMDEAGKIPFSHDL